MNQLNNQLNNQQNLFDIKKDKINFDHLWKITHIDVDTVTFTKYEIQLTQSLNNSDNSTVTLKNVIGIEIHKVSPDIQMELCGTVGKIIKSFEASKFNKHVKISKIIYL